MSKMMNSVVENLIEMGYEAEVTEVKKNNGVVKTGVTVKVKGNNIAPTVYFTEGETVEMMVERCVEAVENTPKLEDGFFDWENVKDRLTMSLVNYDRNKDRGVCIRQIPGTDLGVIVKVLAMESIENGRGFVTIKPEHLESFGISEEQLFIIAEEKLQNANDYSVKSMAETLCELQGIEYDPTMAMFAPPMDVVSNESKVNGAVAMLNRNCQRELSDKYNGNFYIIPSSIHECLILPFDEEMKEMIISSGMINEVNDTQVAPDEVLSDKLYYYDAEEDCIKVA